MVKINDFFGLPPIHEARIGCFEDLLPYIKSCRSKVERIATLNDGLRVHFVGGGLNMTQGVYQLATDTRLKVLMAMRNF